jgi:hypothetical protein
MENLDVIILSAFAATGFIIFIVGCFKEFAKMEKEEYRPSPSNKKFGRDAVYDLMERMFDDKQTKGDKIKLIKTFDRTLQIWKVMEYIFQKKLRKNCKKKEKSCFVNIVDYHL